MALHLRLHTNSRMLGLAAACLPKHGLLSSRVIDSYVLGSFLLWSVYVRLPVFSFNSIHWLLYMCSCSLLCVCVCVCVCVSHVLLSSRRQPCSQLTHLQPLLPAAL